MLKQKVEVREPIISLPGLLLLGSRKDLIACNAEAIQILSYPEKPAKGKQLTALVADKIPMDLALNAPQGRAVAEFLSGRRRYVCTRHGLDMPGVSKVAALILERVICPEVTLYAISKRYRLTPREREATCHLFRGLTGKEIAVEMNISPNTVKALLRLIMTKMGVNTRAGLVGRIAGTSVTDLNDGSDLGGVRR